MVQPRGGQLGGLYVTDLERLSETFTAIGVKWETYPAWGGAKDDGAETTMRIDGEGYGGFFHTFDFDADGKLLSHGGWE